MEDLPPARAERGAEVRPVYLEALTLVERLHRRLLDVIKDEFDRRGRADINAVQALLLYNIGDNELTAGELRTRGYYLGSNVSYNVKKLVEMGYLHHARSRVDRRSVRISLTAEGQGSARHRRGALREACPAPSNRSAASSADEFKVGQQRPGAPGALLDRPDQISPLISARSAFPPRSKISAGPMARLFVSAAQNLAKKPQAA